MSETAASAGRLIAVGIDGEGLAAATRRTLERLGPGMVILLRRNVADPEQLRALVATLHALPSRPLVAIDHEGGRVTRLAPPFTAFPSAAEVGRAGVAAARLVGEAIGRELASVGIDVDFAPVLDVADPAGSSFVGDRAFAGHPQRAAELGLAFAAGLLAAGIVPCGKHFPGHGATDADSHDTEPVVGRTRDQLEAIDLVPFRAAIAAGIPMLMSAHVRYPALDPDRMATMSRPIAGDLLRRHLGFRGPLWSDDLTMRAVANALHPAAAAVAAVGAGVDGVMICHDLDAAQQAAERLALAVPPARLAEAARRLAVARPPRPHIASRLRLPAADHVALAGRVRAMAAAGIA